MWPHPMLALNPSFEPGGTVDDLAAAGALHPDAAHVFRIAKSEGDPRGRGLTLHRHQAEAIKAAQAGRNYLLTTGTGSGKSLAYIVPIVDHVLRTGSGQGPKAVVVYPMNALANSQVEELDKFLKHGPWGDRPPVTYQRYTGQDRDDIRDAILADPPDILLTNYVMLELILTRVFDRRLRQQFGNLRFLVLDELHTYRGRQGSDVAMLVRRVRQAAARAGPGGSPSLLCVGTSATLSSEGSPAERKAHLAKVASELFRRQGGRRRCDRRDAPPLHPPPRRRRRGAGRADRAGEQPRRRPDRPRRVQNRPAVGVDRGRLRGGRSRRAPGAGQAAGHRRHRRRSQPTVGANRARSRGVRRGHPVPVDEGTTDQGPGHSDAGVRLPAAPVPEPGRHRLRHPRTAGKTGHDLRTRTLRGRRPEPGVSPAGVLPGVRPGLLRGRASALRNRSATGGPGLGRPARRRRAGPRLRVPLPQRRQPLARRLAQRARTAAPRLAGPQRRPPACPPRPGARPVGGPARRVVGPARRTRRLQRRRRTGRRRSLRSRPWPRAQAPGHGPLDSGPVPVSASTAGCRTPTPGAPTSAG